jgi:mitochondrial GTPase 1
MLFVHMIFIN